LKWNQRRFRETSKNLKTIGAVTEKTDKISKPLEKFTLQWAMVLCDYPSQRKKTFLVKL